LFKACSKEFEYKRLHTLLNINAFASTYNHQMKKVYLRLGLFDSHVGKCRKVFHLNCSFCAHLVYYSRLNPCKDIIQVAYISLNHDHWIITHWQMQNVHSFQLQIAENSYGVGEQNKLHQCCFVSGLCLYKISYFLIMEFCFSIWYVYHEGDICQVQYIRIAPCSHTCYWTLNKV
jgi:hypothetical protein